jgi:hypothetical protein
MGSVQLARAGGGRLRGQAMAIKRLHANIAQDPQYVGMFLDEAWMTAALKHPNVVQVAAWGEDDRGMFLAVELVQGVSLARLIKESRENKEPFAERTVAFLGSQMCAGMAAAHDLRGSDGKPLGLVHRDLTPGNILVGFDGIVKIADFGIAKAEERITHTRTGTLKGKPAYMAPEQARGGNVDCRADLFSFGVMMFELLAGRRPWTAKGTFEVMMETSTLPTPDLRTLRVGVNPLFVEIVERCLQKKADDRWKDANEIQARLDGWRRSKGFDGDDVASFAHFVRRNSVRQIAWFEQALRGDFARGGAPTFKEMEERIDRSRKTGLPSGEHPAPRPAAGAPAAAPPASPGASEERPVRTVPMPQQPALPINPAAARAPAGNHPRADLDRTMALDDSDLEVAHDSNDLAATTYEPRYAQRPFAQPAAGGHPDFARAAAGVQLGAIAAAPAVPVAASGARGVAPTTQDAVVPEATELMQTSPFARAAPPVPTVHAPPATLPSPAPPRRSRAPLLILLVAVPLVGAAALAFWYRDRIPGIAPTPTPSGSAAASGAPAGVRDR